MSPHKLACTPAAERCDAIDHNSHDVKAFSDVSSSAIATPLAIVKKPLPSRSINDRHLVPAGPIKHTQPPKVSTATESVVPPSTAARPRVMGGGPTSGHYVVPPRPKPGRKPATDNPASKRKAQNRESQRAFRARKAAKLDEMQAQVETTESRHREEVNDLLNELEERDRHVQELKGLLLQAAQSEKKSLQERDFWKDQAARDRAHIDELERQLREHNQTMLNTFSEPSHVVFSPQHGSEGRATSPHRGVALTKEEDNPNNLDSSCGNCNPNGDCACMAELIQAPIPHTSTPLEEPSTAPVNAQDAEFAQREIDFTSQFASKRYREANQPSVAFHADSNEEGTKCGFCTDDSNCLCNDRSLQQLDLPPIVVSLSPISQKRSLDGKIATGPGSCSDCQTNPAQRAWCQRVAQLRGSSNDGPPSPASRAANVGKVLKTMEPRIDDALSSYTGKSSIGCSEAFKLFDGRFPMDSDRMDWIGNLKPIFKMQSDRGTQPARKYSALELDTAGVIATLGHTLQPIQTRPSDGDNATLVRIAQQRQASTQSPRADSGSPLHITSQFYHESI